jgi:uncharacterized protein (DUF1778 family)
MKTAERRVRLKARVTPETLAIVKRAAEIKGLSVGDFVSAVVEAAADRAIEQAETIRVSVEDHEAFSRAIQKSSVAGATQ